MGTHAMILHRHKFVKAVGAALRHRCGVCTSPQGVSRVLVAVSGGADSVALLRAVVGLRGRRRWPLQVAVGHVQHHLRDDAECDAAFVSELAEQLGLPVYRVDLDLSSKSGNIEANARLSRYEALSQMADAFDAHCVAAGHHSDDQLETLLMRLLRGSSVRGLGGMAWRRRLLPGSGRWLIRPLLAVDRAAVEQFLGDLDQPWRDDPTNADRSRLRAALRHRVLPVLRDIRPDAAKKAVALADHMRRVHRAIEGQVDQAMAHVTHTGPAAVLSRNTARLMPTAVLQSVLRRLLLEAGAKADQLGARALQAMTLATNDGKGGRRSFALSNGVCLEMTRDEVRVMRQPQNAIASERVLTTK